MPHPEPARSREQRKQDVVDRLEKDTDAWVSTASVDGAPTLVPLWFVWDGEALLMATRRTNPTAVNLTPAGRAHIALGHTRDVVMIEAAAEVVEGTDLPTASGDAFAAKFSWDLRGRPAWVYLRFTPHAIRAWRESNEQPDRDLMTDGHWLV
ncbi:MULTISPECIES: pyridoxamine 5'-phosphate oxidase family protein [unclassified Streptomyces]|uniref:pyridoxamine 5'-phosphate oxidase family protein n=1 Tax=unclassified Streptomyces TaxID=2593676 RepID=UPI002ED486F5|nr:pyridoxamine 5'-phosphate oxidase family protein [Streptomyces sp. NBC_00891]WSY05392.1 pyridoxamine 5'-phosphate oxidase family protein [Streptomyces sp. NBC_00890]WSZ07016.1 pyridoxamine 5'-phosphate oxidase family protein [Streptomyces sp. NBC_00869]WSZ25486.1 pyridoxamine 5'-phosphate oxidase family protein [Streptomyces sp. NBC_00870]